LEQILQDLTKITKTTQDLPWLGLSWLVPVTDWEYSIDQSLPYAKFSSPTKKKGGDGDKSAAELSHKPPSNPRTVQHRCTDTVTGCEPLSRKMVK